MPNGANHLSPNTYHFYSFLSRYEYNFRRGLRGLHGLMAALLHYITEKESV